MTPDDNPRLDPWLYECKEAKNTLHHWVKLENGTSECKNCHIRQTIQQTRRCFTEY